MVVQQPSKLMASKAGADFERTLVEFYECDDEEDMPEIVDVLEESIDAVRWEDSVKPGAFYSIRPTH